MSLLLTTILIMFGAGICSSSARNIIKGDSSFETGYGEWQKTGKINSNSAYDGNCSLKINNTLTSRARFVLKPGKKYFFTAYLKAAKASTPVIFTAYRTNWMGKNIVKHVRVGKEWKRYTLEIPPQNIDTHNEIWMMINPCGKELLIDACQFEEEKKSEYKAAEAVSVICKVLSPVEGNILFPDEEKKILISLFNSSSKNKKLKVFCSATDFYGNVVMNESRHLDISTKNSQHSTFELKKLSKKGFYLIKYGVVDKNRQLREKEASLCIVDKPLPFSMNEGSLFGMCGSKEETIPVLGRIGVKWSALAVRWPWIYPTRGKLNEKYLSNVEKKIKLREKHGINTACYLRRTPPWATVKKHPYDIYPPKKKFIKDYDSYVFEVVSRFKDKVKLWQLWGGETDLLRDHVIGKINFKEDQFIDILSELYKAGYQGAKRADPKCIVATGGVSGVDCEKSFEFSSKVLARVKGFYDEFVIHPYCYPSQFGGGKRVQSPEEHHLAKIYRNATKTSGKGIWNGEYGFSIDPTEKLDSQDSKKMAAYMLRSYLLSASVPKVKRLMWYSVTSGDNFSIWSWPNPRPAVAAYAALAQVLTGTKNPKKLQLGSYILGYTFTKGSGSIAALWVPENKSIKIHFTDTKNIKFVNAMGNVLANKKTITLSGMPLYILSDKNAGHLRQLIAKSKVMLRPVGIKLRLESSRKLNIYLTNQLNQEINGKIKIKLPTAKNGIKVFYKEFSRLRSGISEKIILDVPALDISKLNRHAVVGEVVTNKGTVKLSKKIELISCPYMPKKVIIDGNLREWQGRPFIELKTNKYLSPFDAFSHGLWTGQADLSIKTYIGWDKNNFYFAARVTDDLFVNNDSIRQIWGGDSIQLAFDCLNDAMTSGYKNDDREFSLGLNTKTKRGMIYQSWPFPPFAPKANIAVKQKGRYTYYELALPFKCLKPLMPVAGNVFGFNFVALDKDYKKVEYWLGLTHGICGGKNPSIFKKIILTK